MILGQVHRLIRKILEDKKKIIFVSHPYSNNPVENKKKVDEICKELFQQGYVPLSPIHLFSFMTDDRHRKLIMLICKLMMIISTQCYFYEYDSLSEGQQEELTFATKVGKPVKVMET